MLLSVSREVGLYEVILRALTSWTAILNSILYGLFIKALVLRTQKIKFYNPTLLKSRRNKFLYSPKFTKFSLLQSSIRHFILL